MLDTGTDPASLAFRMTTHLILVSHALTEAIRTASFPGDEPLSPPLDALPELAERIGAMGPPTRALRGPERRALETAAALGLDLPFAVDPALRECDYGRWGGRRFDEVQIEDPDGVAAWIGEPAAAPHGGESLVALLKRTGAWMDRLGETGGRMVAVTHPSIIRAAMLHGMEAPAHVFWRINVEPLSLVDLRGNRGRWTLRALVP